MAQITETKLPNGFTLRPGDGWIFAKSYREGHHTLQGHLAVSDTEHYQIQAEADDDKPNYKMRLREFDTWKTVAEFELPKLGSNPYVEGEVTITYPEAQEVDGVKVKTKKLKVRAFRGSTRENEPVLRIRLPQIMRSQGPANQVIP